MSDISYEYIYILAFIATFFVTCVVSSVYCGDPLYTKIKNCCCCRSNKVEEKYSNLIIQEV